MPPVGLSLSLPNLAAPVGNLQWLVEQQVEVLSGSSPPVVGGMKEGPIPEMLQEDGGLGYWQLEHKGAKGLPSPPVWNPQMVPTFGSRESNKPPLESRK